MKSDANVFDSSGHEELLSELLARPLREAASWHLTSEVVRRYPTKLFILHSFPIEGVDYDCLRVSRIDRKGGFDLNRSSTGSAQRFHVDRGEEVWSALLMNWITTPDRRKMVREISAWLGMSSIKKVPPSSDRAVVYRVIAAFLLARGLDREAWTCDGGLWVRDTGQVTFNDKAIRRFGLDLIPKNLEAAVNTDEDPAANCWFLNRDGQPVIAISTDGWARNVQGKKTNIVRRYRTRSSVDDCVAALSGLTRP